jgi:hypothetical protein
LLGVPAPAGFDGVDLSPFDETGTRATRVLFFEEDHEGEQTGPRRAGSDGRFKLHRNLDTGEQQLFDLSWDPAEKSDVGSHHPAAIQRLSAQLDAFLAGPSEDGPAVHELDDEEREHLRALGYLE